MPSESLTIILLPESDFQITRPSLREIIPAKDSIIVDLPAPFASLEIQHLPR